MAREIFIAEKGLGVTAENGQDTVFELLRGTAAPGGDTGEQDDAPLGSLYFRSGTNELYKKNTDTNALADWELLSTGAVTIDELSWRNETVIAATNDTLSAGSGIDPTAWSDNEQGLDGDDIPNGTYVIGDVDGTPILFEKTAQVSATSITLVAATQIIAANDTFVVQNFLPDSPASQEEQAIIHFPSATGPGIKIADFNWALADGITLNGYSESQGPITGTDTVQVAIEKTGGDVSDLVTLSGVARGSTVLGAFASPASLLLAATYTIKSALQRLGDLMAQLRGVESTGITAVTTVDSVPVATVRAVKWLVMVSEDATPANRQAFEVYALNNGVSGGATDNTTYAKLKVGANFNLTLTVDVATTDMRLRAASSSAGVTVVARRIEVIKSVL